MNSSFEIVIYSLFMIVSPCHSTLCINLCSWRSVLK